MNPLRLRTLMTNLPGMAAVVNSFDSPQVQLAVFEALIAALDDKMDADNPGVAAQKSAAGHRPVASDLGQDLIDGDSIHSVRM